MRSGSVRIACAYRKAGGEFQSHVAGQYVTFCPLSHCFMISFLVSHCSMGTYYINVLVPCSIVPYSIVHCFLFHFSYSIVLCFIVHCSIVYCPLSHCSYHCPLFHCSYHCSLFYCSHHCSLVPCPLYIVLATTVPFMYI